MVLWPFIISYHSPSKVYGPYQEPMIQSSACPEGAKLVVKLAASGVQSSLGLDAAPTWEFQSSGAVMWTLNSRALTVRTPSKGSPI